MIRFWALVKKELLVLSRDRHGLFVLFGLPSIFILIIALALRDAMSPTHPPTTSYVLINQDAGQTAEDFAAVLRSITEFRQERLAGTATGSAADGATGAAALQRVRAAVAADRYKFAVIIPPDFSARVKASLRAALEGEKPAPAAAGMPHLTIIYSPTILPQAKAVFLLVLRQAALRMLTTLSLGQLTGGDGGAAKGLPELLQSQWVVAEDFAFRDASQRTAITSVQQSVPAWLVFAMFFVVIPISTVLIVERQQGSLTRLRIIDVSAFQLLSAKIVPYYLVNMVQLAISLAMGVWIVPLCGGDRLELGHSWLGLWLIGSATSCAGIGFALLVASVARTSVQATTVGGIFNVLFGALGGIMVPKTVMPEFMQRLSVISPMSWALEGFWDIFLRGGDWIDVLPKAAALMAFGAVGLLLASALFARMQRL
jgi:ABC-2 type transport system permease protein